MNFVRLNSELDVEADVERNECTDKTPASGPKDGHILRVSDTNVMEIFSMQQKDATGT